MGRPYIPTMSEFVMLQASRRGGCAKIGCLRGRAKARPYKFVVGGDGVFAAGVSAKRPYRCGAGMWGHQAKEMRGMALCWTARQARAVAMTVSSWAPGGAP